MNIDRTASRLGAFRFLAIPLLILGLHAGGCTVTDRQVISQAANVHKELEPAVIRDPVLANYLQEVGDRIVRAAQELSREGFGPRSHKSGEDTSWMYQDMQFHLVNSKTLNAFTTGGKHMYIYTELMQHCRTEDELAAVMAHEYAHVYARHVKKGMERQYTMLGIAAGAGIAGAAAGYQADDTEGALTYGSIAAGAALAAGQFIGMGYTRKDEDEADKLGFWFYCRAGWDPQQFAGFFQTLIDKGYDKTPEIMSDHPKLSHRVAATRGRIKQLPPDAERWRRPPVADARRFAELKERAARVGKSMPNDQSLQQAQLLLAAFPSCVTPEDQPEQKRARSIVAKAIQQAKRS